MEQLKQYESSIESMQNENDELLAQLDELTRTSKEALAEAKRELTTQIDELSGKLATTERQNLKLKAKLKQLMATTAAAAVVSKEESQPTTAAAVSSTEAKINSIADDETQTHLIGQDVEKLEASNLYFKGLIKVNI
jgi:predicted translin family RNA/ssDNA-binding protein